MQWRYHHNRPSTVLARIDFLGILNFQQNKTNFRQSYWFLKSEKPNYRGTRKFSYKRVPQKFSKIFRTNATMYKQPWGLFWTFNQIKMVDNSLLVIFFFTFHYFFSPLNNFDSYSKILFDRWFASDGDWQVSSKTVWRSFGWRML